MRLVNTYDYSLFEAIGTHEGPYAILSHTWNATGEVTFDDMANLDVARAKSAWPKVERTCALARDQGIPFVWIDTCCIDKSSSAELTEAINSMFEWYKKAAVCYTHLFDLAESPNGDPESERARDQLRADLGRCRWFSRGWTLQELIAPKVMEFYDGSWTNRGTKAVLMCEISLITDVDVSVLSNSEELSTIPVARKMSWAAKRLTTRLEDTAYSLLGIFDVNLPLIYGEGARAFVRLQEAIAQSTNDLSLFAWSEDERHPSFQSFYGILAQSPRQFARCCQLERIADPLRHDSQSFTITNRGVEFQTSLKIDYTEGDYLMHLHCRDAAVQRPEGRLGMVAIRLVKISSGFARHRAGKVFVDDHETTNPAAPSDNWDPFVRSVPVAKVVTPSESERLHRRFNEAFRFRVQAPPGVTWEMVTYNPELRKASRDPGSLRPSYWDPATSVFLTEGYEYFTGVVYITFSSRPNEPFAILCGLLPPTTPPGRGRLGSRMNPWVALCPPPVSSWRGSFSPTSRAEDRISDLKTIISLRTQMTYPHFLARLGQTIRASISRGKILPDRAMMKYREGRRSDLPENAPPAYYRLVKVLGVTKGPSTDRKHDILISLEEQIELEDASRLWSVRAGDEIFARYDEESDQNIVVE